MRYLLDAWDRFVETLNTKGGTVALLFVSTFILAILCLRQEHWHTVGEEASMFRNTFSGFAGALLLALTGNKDKSNGNGNGNGSTTPTTEVKK